MTFIHDLEVHLVRLLVPLMVTTIVLMFLNGVIDARPRSCPRGVHRSSGADWVHLRVGGFRPPLLGLFRLMESLLWLDVLVVTLAAVANTGWGLLLFASPILAIIIWFLIETLSVRTMQIDARKKQVTVRWGLFVPFTWRVVGLADFNSVVVTSEKNRVLAGPYVRVWLEGVQKPLEVPYGADDYQQAYELARHIGFLTGLPVRH
jgi:hypothetical protein